MTHRAGGLRAALRQHTVAEHERLDALMGGLALGSRQDYARFLCIQYRARVPIEAWLAANLPPALVPPVQSLLARTDLGALGHTRDKPGAAFTAPADHAIGVAWVIAGSSLGNRTILAQRRKKGLDAPHAFLSCPAMPLFFKHFTAAMLEADRETRVFAPAIAGARSAFARFEMTARQEIEKVVQ